MTSTMTTNEWGTFSNLKDALTQVPCSQHLVRDNVDEEISVKEGDNYDIVSCFTTDSLSQTFRTMASEKISSVPVINHVTREFEGWLTLLNIVQYITQLFWGESDERWIDFLDKSDEFKDALVEDAMNYKESKTNSYLYYDASTFTALELLAKPKNHQLCVLNPTNERVRSIMTQSMLISFIRQNMHLLGTLADKNLYELEKQLFKTVYKINASEHAINAYKKMDSLNVTGLAIVDDEDELLGCISIKDLKGIGSSGQNFTRLFKSVEAFKRLTRNEDPKIAPSTHYSGQRVPLTGLYLTGDGTFRDLIHMMDDGNINRIFICSQASVKSGRPKAINVVTQTDVLEFVLNHIRSSST